MSDSIRNKPTLPPQEEAIRRAKCVHPTETFVEFSQVEIDQSIRGRFKTLFRTIVRQFPDHTENRVGTSGIAERAFKLLPEQRATSGTTT